MLIKQKIDILALKGIVCIILLEKRNHCG